LITGFALTTIVEVFSTPAAIVAPLVVVALIRVTVNDLSLPVVFM
jgi:hypothetical protein